MFIAEKSKHAAGGKEKKKEGKKRKRGSANADSNGYIEGELKDLNVGCGISICGGSKTWALAVGLSTTFYQQYVRGEEIIREPRN